MCLIVTLPFPEREIILREQGKAISERKAVDVVAIARSLGLRYYEESLGNISGKLLFNRNSDNNGWEIIVNVDEAPVRRRFTTAHEIAHFLLHRGKGAENGVVDDIFYRSALSGKIETEANKFAAEILMPWDLINICARENASDPEQLAHQLGVSQTAMNIRLGLPT